MTPMDSKDLKIIERILLKNGFDVGSDIKRYRSGIANRTYSVGDTYVVKIEGEWKGILAHQKEIVDRMLSVGAKVPRIIDSGDINDKAYLLMEKLRGTNIVYDWLKFNMRQKENFISQLAEELQKFHSIRFDDYAVRIASGKKFRNLKDAIGKVTDFTLIAKNRLGASQREAVDFLEAFYKAHLPLLDETGTAVLVHNDIHLENIFYEGDAITGIIDFDWVSQAPKDYELWKIVEVFRDPKYTVEERLESLYENYKMTKEFGFLKKYYPALFKKDNLADRIRLYYLEKIIDRVVGYQNGKWDEKTMQIVQEEIKDLYKSDWLDNLVSV